jgi:hypothetical protein
MLPWYAISRKRQPYGGAKLQCPGERAVLAAHWAHPAMKMDQFCGEMYRQKMELANFFPARPFTATGYRFRLHKIYTQFQLSVKIRRSEL